MWVKKKGQIKVSFIKLVLQLIQEGGRCSALNLNSACKEKLPSFNWTRTKSTGYSRKMQKSKSKKRIQNSYHTSELFSPSSNGAVIRVSSRLMKIGDDRSCSSCMEHRLLSKLNELTSKLFAIRSGLLLLWFVLGCSKLFDIFGIRGTSTVTRVVSSRGAASKLIVGWW